MTATKPRANNLRRQAPSMADFNRITPEIQPTNFEEYVRKQIERAKKGNPTAIPIIAPELTNN
ncbi:MAG TPA: hypothetical protein QF353_06960 [Gammaproteobacteria bacterium]|nr:hypothetical protein [Gammaproteobacteria bacterium]